jgi:hypothetical protein
MTCELLISEALSVLPSDSNPIMQDTIFRIATLDNALHLHRLSPVNKMKNWFQYIIMYALLNMGATCIVHGQETTSTPPVNYKPTFKERIILGGNFGIQFGSITLIDVSPQVGYRISDRLIAGVGATYQYYDDNYYHYSTNIFGGRTFLRYYVFRNFFAHAEYELLNYEPYYTSPFESGRVNVNSYLVGGGYTQQIGGNSFIGFEILWNLNETQYTLYNNPIIRIGFGMGL